VEQKKKEYKDSKKMAYFRLEPEDAQRWREFRKTYIDAWYHGLFIDTEILNAGMLYFKNKYLIK
jgi:hypothetical protein